MTIKPDPLAYPPRGLTREEAARYIGVGTTLFDEMVADHRMPAPRRIGGKRVWDRLSIDMAFSQMPGGEDGESEADRILKKALSSPPSRKTL